MIDLTVVIPVYNEAECVESMARSWLDVLGRQGLVFSLLLINDGSRDSTADRLRTFAGDPRVRVINKSNDGHGPTILQGYRLACADSLWVFQVDSDDEIAASAFPGLWEKREKADGVFGVRQGRKQTLGQRFLSTGSCLLVRCLCGVGGVRDVNVPFRLMRCDCLAPLLGLIPPSMFAPNVAISGLMQRQGCRIVNIPVLHCERRTGVPSLVSWAVIRMGFRSLVQVGWVLLLNRRRG